MNHVRLSRRFAVVVIGILLVGLLPGSVAASETHYFVVTTAGTAVAGSAQNLTVEVHKFPDNTVDAAYTGIVSFSSSDANVAVVLPAQYTFTGTGFDDGRHTFVGGLTLATVGNQTVTATQDNNSMNTGMASLTVTVGALNHLVLSPATASITTDATQTYAVEGFDFYGNSLGDVTSSTNLTITGTGTSCEDATHTCKSTTVGGPFTVTGTDGTATGTASLTVTVGVLNHLVLSPPSSSITTDHTQTYSAEGFDANNNSRGVVTSSTTLTIVGTGASCNNTNHTCESTTVGGPFTVTGTDDTATGTASLTVTVGALDHLVLSPPNVTITAGGNQPYTAIGEDFYGNSLGDVTASTTFTIDSGVACPSKICAPTLAGPYTVIGTDSGHTGTTTLTVNAAGLDHLVLSPPNVTITAGGNQPYTAIGEDFYGNSLGDVTASTTFTIDSGVACPSKICAPTLAGPHTVIGTDSGHTGTTTLTVNPAAITSLTITPAGATITAGASQSYVAMAHDTFDNSWVVTPTTTFTISGAGSGCTQAACTSTLAGDHTVTGLDVGGIISASTTLHVIAAAVDHLVLTPSTASLTAGGNQAYTAQGFDSHGNSLGDVTSSTIFTISGAGSSCTVATCTSTLAGDHTVTGTDGSATGTATLHVNVGTATHFTVGGLFSPRPTGVSGIVTVNAFDQFGNAATGYGGTVHITSSDSSATLPANGALSGGVGSFNVTLRTLGTQSVTATDTVTASITGSQMDIIVAANAAIPATYHPITPVRMVDSRTSNGLSGKLHANVPQTFQVSGRPGVPSNATAVTGNVTVVNSTYSWAVYLGPDPVANPTTSTINFSAGEITGNGLTVALSGGGTLSATFISTGNNTTDLTFDVTGYFTPLGDNDADTYHPMTPTRLLDTRVGNGLPSKLPANTPRIFQVAGRGPVPSNAKAVTGNVTVVNSTNSWAVYLGPIPTATPSTSTINFMTGEIKANSLTVALGAGGTLSATFISTAGNTTDLVFDVTGYYTADLSGSKFVPLTPARLLDSRTGNGMLGKLPANSARSFQVGTRGGVPSNASGVTGNVTVVNETNSWAVFVGPTPTNSPSTSTLNFNQGDIKANGLTVALGTGGILSCTYISTAGNTTDLVFDVTGYFVP